MLKATVSVRLLIRVDIAFSLAPTMSLTHKSQPTLRLPTGPESTVQPAQHWPDYFQLLVQEDRDTLIELLARYSNRTASQLVASTL